MTYFIEPYPKYQHNTRDSRRLYSLNAYYETWQISLATRNSFNVDIVNEELQIVYTCKAGEDWPTYQELMFILVKPPEPIIQKVIIEL